MTRRCTDCRFLKWEFWDLACYCDETHWQSWELERSTKSEDLTAERSETHIMRDAFKRAETCVDFQPYEESKT